MQHVSSIAVKSSNMHFTISCLPKHDATDLKMSYPIWNGDHLNVQYLNKLALKQSLVGLCLKKNWCEKLFTTIICFPDHFESSAERVAYYPQHDIPMIQLCFLDIIYINSVLPLPKKCQV